MNAGRMQRNFQCPRPQQHRELPAISWLEAHLLPNWLEKDWQFTERAMELLRQQLDEISPVVPPTAVAQLQKVPLYFSPEYPGKRAVGEYHPDAGWLRANGRRPGNAKAVEFAVIRIFEAETRRMPNFALHELAHALHNRFLGPASTIRKSRRPMNELKPAAYTRIERWHGNGKPNTFERAYAMMTPQEYFAETSEAYFIRNDFFPLTRDELKRHDPQMLTLLESLVGSSGECCKQALAVTATLPTDECPIHHFGFAVPGLLPPRRGPRPSRTLPPTRRSPPFFCNTWRPSFG